MRRIGLLGLAFILLSFLPGAASAGVCVTASNTCLVADRDDHDWDRGRDDYYWRHRDRDDRHHWKHYRHHRRHRDRDDYYRCWDRDDYRR